MPDKQPTHKSILALISTAQDVQAIAEQLSQEKGVPVKGPMALKLIVDYWKEMHGEAAK